MRRLRRNTITNDKRALILPKVPSCKYCGAFKFYRESDLFCCMGGDVHLAQSTLPECLVSLITGVDSRSKEFQEKIRTYNNHFAFTTIGIHCDEQLQRRDCGIYTVRVQGRVYHFLGDLMPSSGSMKLSGLQFYFYDTEHQAENRMATLPRLDYNEVEILVNLLSANPYSMFLKHVSSLHCLDQYNIVIRSDPGLAQRGYNKPTSSEVAGIWIEDEEGESNNSKSCDIRVYTKSGGSHNVCYYYGCYDPLQYVLILPNGDSGWHVNIPRAGQGRRRNMGISPATISKCGTFQNVIVMEEEGVIASTLQNTMIDASSGTTKNRI